MKANTLCLVSQSLLNRKSERMPCSDSTELAEVLLQGSSIAPIGATQRQVGDI